MSALGPTNKEPDLHTRTAEELIAVMPARGVRRFVGISGAGILADALDQHLYPRQAPFVSAAR